MWGCVPIWSTTPHLVPPARQFCVSAQLADPDAAGLDRDRAELAADPAARVRLHLAVAIGTAARRLRRRRRNRLARAADRVHGARRVPGRGGRVVPGEVQVVAATVAGVAVVADPP